MSLGIVLRRSGIFPAGFYLDRRAPAPARGSWAGQPAGLSRPASPGIGHGGAVPPGTPTATATTLKRPCRSDVSGSFPASLPHPCQNQNPLIDKNSIRRYPTGGVAVLEGPGWYHGSGAHEALSPDHPEARAATRMHDSARGEFAPVDCIEGRTAPGS